MSEIRLTLLWILFLMPLFSCKREKVSHLPSERYATGINARINDIQIIHDSLWVACAGNRNSNGFFLHSADQGKTWFVQQTQFDRSVYTLEIMADGKGLAGGDFLDLWKTTDFGMTWEYLWLGDQVPFNEEDRPGIRDIFLIDDSTWHFCGGENLGEGVVYKTNDAGSTWEFDFHQHEFRSITQNSLDQIVAGGHGRVILYTDEIKQSQLSAFKESFITSMVATENNHIVACCFDGKIIHSVNGGNDWSEVLNVNSAFRKRINWNCITKRANQLVCLGTDGSVAISYDHGKQWRIEKISEDKNLLTGVILEDKILAGDSEGNVHLIDIFN